MNPSAPDEGPAALRPITSLLRKSAQAVQRLAPGTWQHTMLQEHLRALHLAAALLTPSSAGAELPGEDDLRAALRAFAEMIRRTEQSQAKFAPGTAPHTLQRNRLSAFRTVVVRIEACLASTARPDPC